MAAETLIQVKATVACFWLANLLLETIKIMMTKKKIECFSDNHELYDSVY